MNPSLLLPSLMAVLPKLTHFSLFLAQATGSDVLEQTRQTPPSPIAGIVGLLIAVIVVVSLWKIFTKAGQPGWASIIPFYNLYILLKIIGKPGWWLLLMFIPFVNIVIAIIVYIGLAKSFGKGAGFGIGMIFLSFIFLPILAFGDARYQGYGAGAMPPPLT